MYWHLVQQAAGMNLRNERVLITGAGGFIGSHLTETLVKKGAKVRALVHYNSLHRYGWLEALPPEMEKEVDIQLGDVRDMSGMAKIMEGCTVVFHLAALIGIPYSYIAPSSYVETNIGGALNMLEGALRCGVERLIHTSTSEVYGTAQVVPMDENHPLRGQSPYSASKIGADKLAESYWMSFGLPVVTVRPFNTYGPRQSDRAVIPTIISQAIKAQRVSLGSLDPVRDFVFVDDTVAGFLAAAEREDMVGETVHFGSGKGVSIRELAAEVAGILGKDIPCVTEKARQRPAGSEVTRLIGDSSKARRLLNWSPATSLNEGLRRTISWIQDNQGAYRSSKFVY
jgi:NAD dependent epimerase/dehydratase